MVLCPVGSAFFAIFKTIWLEMSFLAEMTAKITLLGSSTIRLSLTYAHDCRDLG